VFLKPHGQQSVAFRTPHGADGLCLLPPVTRPADMLSRICRCADLKPQRATAFPVRAR